jgi:hypothetical protein
VKASIRVGVSGSRLAVLPSTTMLRATTPAPACLARWSGDHPRSSGFATAWRDGPRAVATTVRLQSQRWWP